MISIKIQIFFKILESFQLNKKMKNLLSQSENKKKKNKNKQLRVLML
jgi:hypothetical protein